MPAWSQDDEYRLLQLIHDTGLTQREIGQKLGRSEAAVQLRLALIRKRIAEGARGSA